MRIRRELWFGLGLMGLIIGSILVFWPWGQPVQNGHLGLLMLALIVVGIMLGFPTAFTLMGMGVFFSWLAYRSVNPDLAPRQVLDLFVQRSYGVMSNDVLIAVPLFVFMGYLVERAALIDKLFRSLHLATARVPGSLAVASIVTCAIFATATGIVGAVVTLMGLLAFPAMLKAGYNIKISAGAITAGGCLGILIPPSVLLIVYGATAGVSVVQLYAGAFFPGLMLAGLYLVYVIVLAKWRPELMPPLPESERRVPLPPVAEQLKPLGRNPLIATVRALGANGAPKRGAIAQLFISLLPFLVLGSLSLFMWDVSTAPKTEVSTAGLELTTGSQASTDSGTGLATPPAESTGLAEPPPSESGTGLAEPPPAGGVSEPPASAGGLTGSPPGTDVKAEPAPAPAPPGTPAPAPDVAKVPDVKASAAERQPTPEWFWITLGVFVVILVVVYLLWTWERLQVFKMLLASFFPLALLILAVLGSIVFGLATPTEAAAVGAFGGFVLAVAYRMIEKFRTVPPGRPKSSAIGSGLRELGGILKESSFLTAKTSAMVCWLFIGSAIFSAAFALLGGQELVEKWVLSMELSPVQFMLLAQAIIFILGWPLEWTEIIVIFMPIFIPLLPHFHIDPLFFGLLVALNLQTAFLSPPVAMAAFYLKGVAPSHVTLNQIFAGMMPFMAIQVIALFMLYMFPGIGLWLPQVLYK
ncbi:MAG TPA: TRAP transporter large permease subunit [Burkholderiales bacterium]|nr:TRAP transporter large permease subunit [Burkholderiales bacterium]